MKTEELFEEFGRFRRRALTDLSLRHFQSRSKPIPLTFGRMPVCIWTEQRVLRMMVQKPGGPLTVPPELEWLEERLKLLQDYQEVNGLIHDKYIYVTVRHGNVETKTDDEWHVDGFSMRTPHPPEQNYIWVWGAPTEFLINDWKIPDSFDPLKHNIHRYFQQHSEGAEVWTGKSDQMYLIDPYCVHRRPPGCSGRFRSFVRISFVPIEIEDDTCTQNPLFPPKVYGREDIRKSLVDWHPDE